jgi:hypothetical protein
MRGFIDRTYGLNYELLKNSSRRFEGKLLVAETDIDSLGKRNFELERELAKTKKLLDDAHTRIKDLCLCDGPNIQKNLFSTNTSDIQLAKAGTQSPWLDLSGYVKIQNAPNTEGLYATSPSRVFQF